MHERERERDRDVEPKYNEKARHLERLGGKRKIALCDGKRCWTTGCSEVRQATRVDLVSYRTRSRSRGERKAAHETKSIEVSPQIPPPLLRTSTPILEGFMIKRDETNLMYAKARRGRVALEKTRGETPQSGLRKEGERGKDSHSYGARMADMDHKAV